MATSTPLVYAWGPQRAYGTASGLGSLQFNGPGSPGAKELYLIAFARVTGSGYTAVINAPTGWTQVATRSTNFATLSVFRATHSATMNNVQSISYGSRSNTTLQYTGSSALQLLAFGLDGVASTPTASALTLIQQNQSTSAVTIPATTGGSGNVIVLSVAGILASSSAGAGITVDATPGAAYFNQGLTSYSATGSMAAFAEIFKTVGPRTITVTGTGISVLGGQIILASTAAATNNAGAQITGLARLSATGSRYPVYAKERAGGPFKATITLTVRRGTAVIKHVGTLTGLAQLSGGRGVARRKPPHYDLTSTAAGEDTRIVLAIPAKTRPTDLLVVTVGYAGTTAIPAPSGWQAGDGGDIDAQTRFAVFTRSATHTDPGGSVTLDIADTPVQVAAVLAVYTPSVIDARTSTVQSASSSRVVFGPPTANPGTLRVTAAAARAASTSGDQIAFVKPLTLVDGATPATPRSQAESDIGRSLGAVVADYSANTELLGQITAVVPVMLRAVTLDLAGIPFFRGYFYARPVLYGRRGSKASGAADPATPPHRNNKIVAESGGRGSGYGEHSNHPYRLKLACEVKLTGYRGIITDSYHSGMIADQIRLSAGGYGTHTGGRGKPLTGTARITVDRGAQLAAGHGTTLTGLAQLAGSGAQTWDRPRGRRHHDLSGDVVLYGRSGSTRINYLRAVYDGSLPTEHTSAHSDVHAVDYWALNPDTGLPYIAERRITRRVWEGVYSGHVLRGQAQAYIEERYTQIRGLVTLRASGRPGPPVRTGQLVGVAVLHGNNMPVPDVEDFEMEITCGVPSVTAYRPAEPEDIQREIRLGNPSVSWNAVAPGTPTDAGLPVFVG